LPELDTLKPIDVRIRITTDEDSEEMVRKKLGLYEFKSTLGSNGAEIIDFLIEAQSPFSSRTIRVKGSEFKGKRKSVTFSVGKGQGTEFTYKYLNNGLKYFDLNRFDSALAYYELAYENKGQSLDPNAANINMFAVQLGFNYAKALHNTCINLNYDTCDLSAKLFKQLLVLFDSGNHRKVFEVARISRENLTAPQNDLAMIGPIIKYSKISKLYSEGKYNASAALASEALEDYETNPEVFQKIGLTKDRLLQDAGVSSLKAAEKAKAEAAPSDQIQSILENAREYLKDIKTPDKTTKSNLAIINQKLMQ